MNDQQRLKRMWDASASTRFVAFDPSTGKTGVIIELNADQYVFKNMSEECKDVYSIHSAEEVQSWELIQPAGAVGREVDARRFCR